MPKVLGVVAATIGLLLLQLIWIGPRAEGIALARVCQGNGTLTVTGDAETGFTWRIQGDGLCNRVQLFEGGPVLTATFEGTGTSNTLGFCSESLFVTDLSLDVQATFRSATTGQVHTEDQRWFAPISTFPLATPFFIEAPNAFGVGVSIHHIFLQCGNEGNMPSASFTWTQTS